MKNALVPLVSGHFYHIYNRGNNRENLFYRKENYIYFLVKYDAYLNDYLDTYAFCLLPNHFHLLVKVKDLSALEISKGDFSSDGDENDNVRKKDLPGLRYPGESDAIPPRDGIAFTDSTISQQFRKFFISYAQAINKQQNRIGSLFQKNFKRIRVDNKKYLTNLIYYIHANPQIHGLIDDFRNWPYSSYPKMLIAKKSHLKKEEVLELFGSLEEFKIYHAAVQDLKRIRGLLLEEE
ncbi:MAG TPA: hypothetical protein ENK44_02040 [Caldithrix abyssi]|uniref:Transposase IS200-like domain-containing protein n=1 Tax=Caldithrix abyssi TaxID=187145 RepID=A0A7V4TXX2_CALAY|nr:hypothetical protein [Caldithrix abyssi]